MTGRIESFENLRWLRRERVERDIETYIIQVLDEPYDVFILKLWNTIFVPFLGEEAGELIGERG